MTELIVRAYRESDQGAVVVLWRECGLVAPWNDPKKDIRRKLSVQRDMFLVGLVGTKLVATVMVDTKGIVAGSTTWRWPSGVEKADSGAV